MDLTYFNQLLSRKDVCQKLSEENSTMTLILRFVGWLCMFFGIYMIFYPFILLIGYIPLLGYIGAGLLTIVAFILSIIFYLIFLVIAWMFARPLLCLILTAVIGLFILIFKLSSDKMFSPPQADITQNNRTNLNTNTNIRTTFFQRVKNL